MADRYRNSAKYRNTDVNSDTVHNLLQTINSMSQRCKNRANTDDILQRIRSIILMHRPHLASRLDLQLPELVMEALSPHSSTPNQITHNFNYKYDYNTNVPGSPNPFMTPPGTQSSLPQQHSELLQPPLQQSFTINQAPQASSSLPQSTSPLQQYQQPPPPPPPPSATQTEIKPETSIETEDLYNFNSAYISAQQNASVTTYKYLLQQIIYIVRKYVRIDLIVFSLQVIDSFDKLQQGDMVELLTCLERETRWSLPMGPNVCRLLAILVKSYCRVAMLVTGQELMLSTIKSEDRLFMQIQTVEQSVQTLLTNVAQSVSAETQALMQQQSTELAGRVQDLNTQLTNLTETNVSMRQQLDALTNQNNAMSTQMARLHQFLNNNGAGTFNLADIEQYVGRFIENYTQMATLANDTARSSELQKTVVLLQQESKQNTMQINTYQQQLQLLQAENAQLKNTVGGYTAQIADFTVQLYALDDTKAQLNAAKTLIAKLQNDLSNISQTAEVPPASEKKKLTDVQIELNSVKNKYDNVLDEFNQLKHKYNELRQIKPIGMVTPRASPSLKIKSSSVRRDQEKIVKNQQVLTRENRTLKESIRNLRNMYDTSVAESESTVRQLKMVVQDMQSRVDAMSSTQPALGIEELKMLNDSSTQTLSDTLSELKSELDSYKEMCSVEIKQESNILENRLMNSRQTLLSNVDSLVNQITPLQTELDDLRSQVNMFETRYETLARDTSKTIAQIET
jgi:Viral Desmoplakin N-terminus